MTASKAAKSIVYRTDYESVIKNVVELNRKLLELRKAFNMLDNRGYDMLLRLLGLSGVNSLIYRTGINAVLMGSAALKPLNTLMRLRHKSMS